MTPKEIAKDLREAARIIAELDHMPRYGERWDAHQDGPLEPIEHITARLSFIHTMYSDKKSRKQINNWANVCVLSLLFAAEFVEKP